MGIETVFIVLGVIVVVAVWSGWRKRRAATGPGTRSQPPRSQNDG